MKYRLLLLLLLFVCQKTWADKGDPKYYSYYNFYTKVTAKPTGAGVVYTQGTEKDFDTNFNKKKAQTYRGTLKTNDSNTAVCTEIEDKAKATAQFHMRAEEKTGYKFVRWEDDNGNEVGNSKDCYVKVTTTNYCGEYTEDDSKDPNKWEDPQANNPDYFDAHYYAIFEPLIKSLIKVKSNNNSWGMATITHEDNSDAVENDIGDKVVLFAYTISYNQKFLRWEKDGQFVSRDNPLRLTVSDENSGEYVAIFDDGYKFSRIKNFGAEHRYITAINDEGSLSNLTAIKLEESYENIIANAGSVIEIYSETTTVPTETGEATKKITYYDFRVQNSSGVDKNYYNFSGGAYLRMPHYTKFADEGTWAFSQADITYNEQGNKTGLRFRDNNGSASFDALRNDPYSQWYIEPMDKDLETHENYFSLNPDDMVLDPKTQKYYTTLRTSWNCRFADDTHNNIKAYIVTGLDDEGVMQKVEVTGGIIPKGVAVLLECNTNSMDDNVLIPTMESATFTQTQNNILKSSTKYFPNQSVEASENFKALGLINGRLGFGGDALTTINGNNGYLQIPNDAFFTSEYTSVTLAELVETGVVGQKYRIVDGDVAAVKLVDNDQLIVCKDDGKFAEPDAIAEEWVDYMHKQSALTVPATYDQSNWIGLRLPKGTAVKNSQEGIAGHKLTGVKGVLTDKVNPELLLDEFPTQGDATEFTMNVYVPASFYGQNHQTGSNGVEYFFVQPKPMELAAVEWGYWDGTKFVMPPSVGSWNQAGLSGEFDFNAAYLTGFNAAELQADHGYTMSEAIVRYKTGSYDHIYVLGNVNRLNLVGDWAPNKGVEMYTADGQTYTTMVRVDNAAGSDCGYFSFSKKLGATWNDISGSHFGAVSDGDFDVEAGSRYDQELSLEASGDSYKIPAGNYWLTITGNNAVMTGMKLVITRVSSNAASAPRRAGEATKQQYVVYPLSLVSNGSSKDGDVITGVAGVTGSHEVAGVDYINLAGQRSTRPWQGVNIVVTRYTDGTQATGKAVF